jgi:hypothetical protein
MDRFSDDARLQDKRPTAARTIGMRHRGRTCQGRVLSQVGANPQFTNGKRRSP